MTATEAGRLIVPIVLGDTRELEAGAARAGEAAASGATDAVESSSKNMGKRLTKVGAGMSLAVTAPLLAMGNAAVDASADVQESLNKNSVVFGNSAVDIENWADRTSKSIGVSRGEALAAAGDFGNLLRAIGTAEKPAADMSKSLVNLAADIGSFNNATSADVLEALKAGLLGEAEPLRKFGVSLTAARIEAEALALGIAKPTKNMIKIEEAQIGVEKAVRAYAEAIKEHGKGSLEAAEAENKLAAANDKLNKTTKGKVEDLTDAQKAQAAYAIIQKDTALANGDFQRSLEGSLANQRKQAEAVRADAQAAFGDSLVPLMQSATGVMTDMAGAANGLGDGTKKALVYVALGAAAMGPLTTVVGGATVAYKALTSAKLADTVATIRNTVVNSAKSGADVVRTLGMIAGVYGRLALAKARDTAATLLNNAANGARGMLDMVRTLGMVAAAYAALGAAKARDTILTIANAAAEKAAAAARAIGTAAQWLLNVAMTANPIGLVVLAIVALIAIFVLAYNKSETFRKIIQALGNAIKQYAIFMFNAWKLVLTTVVNFITSKVVPTLAKFGAFWASLFTRVWGYVKSGWARINSLFQAGSRFVTSVRDRIVGAFGSIGGTIRSMINSVINIVRRARIPGFSIPSPTGGSLFKFSGFAPFAGIPSLAQGATVLPRRGGTLVRLAEAGRAESVVDTGLLNKRLAGTEGGSDTAKQIAEAVREALAAMSWKLDIDPSGMARVVATGNLRRPR